VAETGAKDLFERIRHPAHEAGLDLSAAFPVDAYNRSVPDAYRLPTLGRGRPCGIVIGNSRTFWPKFLEALRRSPRLCESAHPVNTYVTEKLSDLLQDLPAAFEVRYAHTSKPSPVAMQRAAQISGLAHTSPSHLSIHPEHGPWIALRAVIVLDADGWWAGEPAPAPDPCTPCSSKPCLEALDRAVAASRDEPAGERVSRHWRLWLGVRDACPIGRTSRYSEEQCEYHYRPSRDFLPGVLRPGC